MENSGTGVEKRSRRVYEFGPFRLDAAERVLSRDGVPVKLRLKDREAAMLTPKVVETLLALVERGGEIVNKDDLMKSVWPDTVVEESNLASNISVLRRALGAMEDGRPYIETFPKRGYRFNAPLREPATDITTAFDEASEQDEEAVGVEGAELIIRRRTRAHILTDELETGEADADEDADGSMSVEGGTRKVGRLTAGESSVAEAASLTRQQTGALTTTEARRRRRLRLTVAAALGCAVAGALLVAWKLGAFKSAPAGEPFARTKLSRVTSSGRATHAAVSPDGQFVAHALESADGQSLWLRHLATGSDKEIVPPSREPYSALTFSRDGHHLYYIKFQGAEGGVLYKLPVLGGTPQMLLKDVDGTATFSPDGKRFAFVRGWPHENKDLLVVADADGSNERILAEHKSQDLFATTGFNAWGPAWSPDGKSIAHPLRLKDDRGELYRTIALTSVADGTHKPLTPHRWRMLGAIAWLPDGDGLIACASDDEPGSPRQLWHVSARDGSARRITNDLHNYDGVSLSADASSLLTVQAARQAAIWVAPEGDAGRATEIQSDRRSDGTQGLAWTSDGRIVYTSGSGDGTDIWTMNPDGGDRKQLTFNKQLGYNVRLSSAGRHIFYTVGGKGEIAIWRMDADGGDAKQITPGPMDLNPSPTQDGTWVFYSTPRSGKPTVWKVSSDGGAPVQVTQYFSSRPVVSTDGKLIAFDYINEDVTPPRRSMGVAPADGSKPSKLFDMPQIHAQVLQWTRDNSVLTYLDTRAGVTNIWGQPLDGGPPTQLTQFTSSLIFRYAFSPDGRQLALSRGTVNSDVVMINSLPPE